MIELTSLEEEAGKRWLAWVLSPSSAAAAAKSRQSCPTLCDPIGGSPPGSHPWDPSSATCIAGKRLSPRT